MGALPPGVAPPAAVRLGAVVETVRFVDVVIVVDARLADPAGELLSAPVGEEVVVVATPPVSPLDPNGVLGGTVVATFVAAESAT